MRYLKTYKIFESVQQKTYKLFESISNIDEIKSNLEDLCLEFEDNNCQCNIEYSMLFYVDIDVFNSVKANSSQWYDSETGQNVQMFSLPDWFIQNCREVESYMQSEGFITKPSIRYALDWENLESVDELADQLSLIFTTLIFDI
jgi:hypothetical protein